MPSLVLILLQAWGICALVMLGFWLVQVKTKNAGYIDIGWTMGVALCALFYASSLEGYFFRKALLVTMIVVWASRLIMHLVIRFIHEGKEDKRYTKIREDWKTNLNVKFFFFFQFQAFLDVLLSIGWLPSMKNSTSTIHGLEWLGVVVWLIGFFGESLADHQLKRFTTNPANKGKTCQEGLWYYSRHPNYFFEWLMWVGYVFFACSSPWGWISLLPMALMYHFLMNVTGVPLAEEQSLKSRGDEYRRYQQTTSIFIPLPKRKI